MTRKAESADVVLQVANIHVRTVDEELAWTAAGDR